MAKMWAGVTAGVTDSIADDFNSSIRFDCKMYKQDITGSMAHAAMLGAKGINSPEDTETILAGLESILVEAVGLPKAAADPVADIGFAQLFAHCNAHPVCSRPVFPGVENQIGPGEAVGPAQAAKHMIQFQ